MMIMSGFFPHRPWWLCLVYLPTDSGDCVWLPSSQTTLNLTTDPGDCFWLTSPHRFWWLCMVYRPYRPWWLSMAYLPTYPSFSNHLSECIRFAFPNRPWWFCLASHITDPGDFIWPAFSQSLVVFSGILSHRPWWCSLLFWKAWWLCKAWTGNYGNMLHAKKFY